MKRLLLLVFATTMGMAMAVAQQSEETKRMQERFLSYVSIESQSVYPSDTDTFPITQNQKKIANLIFNELKSFGKVDVKMSQYYYIYVKVPSNIKQSVPSIMFLCHMDVTPDCNASNIKPQIHYNYDGGNIVLGDSLVLSPKTQSGKHLNDLIGKTIITTDGTTLLGSDCKAGCAILVTLIEQMVKDPKFKHGDVYFCFCQNEETGLAAAHMDLSYLDKVPDMLIDVDGGDYGEFSAANFTAEMRTYIYRGNSQHPSNAKTNGYADSQTAMAYFIGQLPPEIHPSYSDGKQGYVHCYSIEQLPNKQDYEASFRIRYFDKEDGVLYRQYLEEAKKKTNEAFPTVKIELKESYLLYDNIEYSMHPKVVEVILNAAEKSGIVMNPVPLRAGSTSSLMVAKGMPGGPCIYSGQNEEHSPWEWCCVEELVDLTRMCKNIITEITHLK